MAEENKETNVKIEGEQVEVTDRGLFDFMGKKEEEKSQEDALVTGVEKLHVGEPNEKIEEKKEEEKKLHRSHSSSSSSSSSSDEEEVGPDGEKKKKKKGLKEKIKEKVSGDHPNKEAEGEKIPTSTEVTEPEVEDRPIVVQKIEVAPEEEKKGFLEKIKEKLPGHHKKEAEEISGEHVVKESNGAPLHEAAGEGHDGKEKKGILGKIMDKLPGYGHKEETDKNAPLAGH